MTGYDPEFLGTEFIVPLPGADDRLVGHTLRKPGLVNEVEIRHTHYSVVMNSQRRSALFAALNIDTRKMSRPPSGSRGSFINDPALDGDEQLGNRFYTNTGYERGHLARRESATWGETPEELQRANDETFFYSNAAHQHPRYNGDEWVRLEDWVLQREEARNGRISSITGPIYGVYPRMIQPQDLNDSAVEEPAGFFKIVCFLRQATGEPAVRTFMMLQDKTALATEIGGRLFEARNYQMTITEIEKLTGLDFGDEVRVLNPLRYHPDERARDELNIAGFPERIEVGSAGDIQGSGVRRDPFEDDVMDVFIAAALVNPEGRDTGKEWVSIINLSAGAVDICHWTLSDNRKTARIGDMLSGADGGLEPGEARSFHPRSRMTLTNSGDTLELRRKPRADGTPGDVLDRVSWTGDDLPAPGIPMVFTQRFVDR